MEPTFLLLLWSYSQVVKLWDLHSLCCLQHLELKWFPILQHHMNHLLCFTKAMVALSWKKPPFLSIFKTYTFYFIALQLCSVSDQINQVKVLEEVGFQWYNGKASRKHRRTGMAKGWAAPAAAPLLPSGWLMSSLAALPDFCISETRQCSCLQM